MRAVGLWHKEKTGQKASRRLCGLYYTGTKHGLNGEIHIHGDWSGEPG